MVDNPGLSISSSQLYYIAFFICFNCLRRYHQSSRRIHHFKVINNNILNYYLGVVHITMLLLV